MNRYLGVDEGDDMYYSAIKEKVGKEYYRIVWLVLKPGLNSKNRIDALNALVIPFVQHSVNILSWNLPEK